MMIQSDVTTIQDSKRFELEHDCRVVEYDGLSLISCFPATAAQIIFNEIQRDRKQVFTHINCYNYSLICTNQSYKNFVVNYSHQFFDGYMLMMAQLLLTHKYYRHLNGTDTYPYLINLLNQSEFKLKIYLLGAEQEWLDKAIDAINKNFPNVVIVGSANGYFDIDNCDELINEINKVNADLLILGMGLAKELDFLIRYYDKLEFGSVWNVGALFDFISQKTKRAPLWMQKTGLETLYRIKEEPKRLFARYCHLLIWFCKRVIKLKAEKS